MKKLHSLAFYALVTPMITMGAVSAMAQQSGGPDSDRGQQGTQRGNADTQSAADRMKARDNASGNGSTTNIGNARNYIDSAPSSGVQASDLMDAEVKTRGGEDVGPVTDLVIDQDGQVVAVVISVGGFLGMGKKDIAIGWDHVSKSGTFDDLELRVDVTRDELRTAPEFERQD